MATPPTRVSYNVPTSGNYSSTTTPKTSNSFDVVAGDLIVVLASAENGAASLSTNPTASGGSVTWTARFNTAGTSGNGSRVTCWTGAVGATATGVTISVARAGTALFWGFSATLWRNHGGVGAIAMETLTTGSETPAIDILTTGDNSAVQYTNNDWNAVDGSSRAFRSINVSAVETVYFRSAANHTVYGCYWSDTGAAGTKTMGLTAPAAQRPAHGGIEILGTTSGTAHALSSTGTGTTTGSLDVTLVPAPLSLSATGTGTSTGSLAVNLVQRVSSTGTGTTTGTAALSLSPGALSATGSGTTTGSAALSSTLALSASGTGTTTGSVNVTIGAVTHSLSSTGTGTSTGSLAVGLGQALSATGTGTSTGSLDVTLVAGSVAHAISATGTGTTTGSAALTSGLALSSTGSGTSTGSVSVALVQKVSATGTGTSAGSLDVTIVTGVTLDLSATGTGTTAGSAAITVGLGLSCTGTGQTGGSLSLRLAQALRSTGSAETGGSLAVVLRMPLAATGYGVSSGSVELTQPTFTFTPPTHEEPIRPGKDMPKHIGYYRLTYAASVVLVNGHFQSIRTPAPDLLAGLVEGTDYFLGGREYEVTRNVMAQLEDDGYTSVSSFGYGMGAYGAGPYGD